MDLTAVGRIELGDDADNVRPDTARKRDEKKFNVIAQQYTKGAVLFVGPGAAIIEPADLPRLDAALSLAKEGAWSWRI